MPELPEMENYKRLLARTFVGKTITGTQVSREKSINIPPSQFTAAITGNRIQSIERRAKHLLFHIDHQKVMLLHLMLGGLIYYGTEEDKPNRTVQVQIDFGPHRLFFIGLRLGYLHLLSAADVQDKLIQLGPEPLGPYFTEQDFINAITAKKSRLKTTLVEQSFLSGIGNYYSDEICWHAGILPMRNCNDLSVEEKSKLYRSIRTVLSEALESGGYMEMPLYKGDTLTGGYDPIRKVYDRGGEPCFRCGRPIIKDEHSSRKLFYCTGCQT
jgi:formamidopyrimidine-DNA glycosylase